MNRTEYDFERTSCACRRCTISCEHVPGALCPEDLARMAKHLGYRDVMKFARKNLLASEGVKVSTDTGAVVTLPTLVPATNAEGQCKFLAKGRCKIHDVSPFGCAFIDAHQGDDDYAVRADALYRALHDDLQSGGEYSSVWVELNKRGLVAEPLATRGQRLKEAMQREGM